MSQHNSNTDAVESPAYIFSSRNESNRNQANDNYKKYYQRFDKFLLDFFHQINCANIIHSVKDLIFKLCKDLIEQCLLLLKELLLYQNIENLSNSLKTLDIISSYIIKEIGAFDSRTKREKYMMCNSHIILPLEKALGLRWNMDLKVNDYKMVQNTL